MTNRRNAGGFRLFILAMVLLLLLGTGLMIWGAMNNGIITPRLPDGRHLARCILYG